MAYGLFDFNRISRNLPVFYAGIVVGFDCAKRLYFPQLEENIPIYWIAASFVLKEYLSARDHREVLEKTKLESFGQIIGLTFGVCLISGLQHLSSHAKQQRP